MIKILGQQAPAATTPVVLLSVTALSTAIVSSITVCNRGANTDYFRVSVSAAGGATADKDYLYYDVPLESSETFVATIGITLGSADVIRVYSLLGTCSFNVFGQENP